jgi:hypothetical protein
MKRVRRRRRRTRTSEMSQLYDEVMKTGRVVERGQ